VGTEWLKTAYNVWGDVTNLKKGGLCLSFRLLWLALHPVPRPA
jgi:hypothetical protein